MPLFRAYSFSQPSSHPYHAFFSWSHCWPSLLPPASNDQTFHQLHFSWCSHTTVSPLHAYQLVINLRMLPYQFSYTSSLFSKLLGRNLSLYIPSFPKQVTSAIFSSNIFNSSSEYSLTSFFHLCSACYHFTIWSCHCYSYVFFIQFTYQYFLIPSQICPLLQVQYLSLDLLPVSYVQFITMHSFPTTILYTLMFFLLLAFYFSS